MKRLQRIEPTTRIARGSERHVFAMSDDPAHLLKVMRSKYLRGLAGIDARSLRGWIKLRRAYGLFRREQRAWTDAMLRATMRGEAPPLAGVGDFVLTPDGLGQLVERITDLEGNTAPTLHDLAVDQPISDIHLAALNSFVAQLYDWHIPAYDLGPKNIVWTESEGRFVLVDGFGDRALIPLVTWNRWCNAWQLDRAFRKTAARSPLQWHEKDRRFSRKTALDIP